MNYKILLFSILLSFNFCFAEKVEIDLAKSQLTWLGKKVSGQHKGTIKFKSGYLNIIEDQVKDGEFIIDMTSIENVDIESPEYKKKLEDHLKSNDFFNISEYAEGKFVIKGLKPAVIPSEMATIIGELTIKNQTHLIQLPVKINQVNNIFQGEAQTTIDRTRWDIRYNSDKFFDPAELGDKLIYNDIEIGLLIITQEAGKTVAQ
ncbi:MAG: YceI family protein [Candidatus Paceibacterota bacterium]